MAESVKHFLSNDNPRGPWCQIHKCEYLATYQFQCTGVPTHLALTCEFHIGRGITDHVEVCPFEIRVYKFEETVPE